MLARDEDGLAELLASPVGKKVNPNFRKQSERGAPVLYFAARSGSAANCRLLMERGATIGLHMRDDDGVSENTAHELWRLVCCIFSLH